MSRSRRSCTRQTRRNRLLTIEPMEPRRLLTAVRVLPGFSSSTLDRNDDGSTAAVDIGFAIDFFGNSRSQVFVNNNGSVTLDGALPAWEPLTIRELSRETIAPFYANVDTRDANSGVVTYGSDMVDGRSAFGVNWIDVGFSPADASTTNSFQLILIDRSDLEPGAFDLEFNYDAIVWDDSTIIDPDGDRQVPARAGFTNGTSDVGTSYELVGSGVDGGLADTDSVTGLINASLRSDEAGRYIFEFRNGSPLNSLGLAGQVFDLGNGALFLGGGTDPFSLPAIDIPTNAVSVDTSDADTVRPGGALGLNLTGAGVTVGVVEAVDRDAFTAAGDVVCPPGTADDDCGSAIVFPTHVELDGRVEVPPGSTTFSNHATHVAGTIVAPGIGNDDAAGFAPGAQIISRGVTTPFGISQADAANIDITNHSYGRGKVGWGPRMREDEIAQMNIQNPMMEDLNNNGTTTDFVDVWYSDRSLGSEDPRYGVYSTQDQQIDTFLQDNPNLLSVRSAGNERNDRFGQFNGLPQFEASIENLYLTFFSGGLQNRGRGWYLVEPTGTPETLVPGSDGNNGTGFDSVPAGTTSKNSLVVGAIGDGFGSPRNALEQTDAGYQAQLDGSITSFTSFGPLDDGRLGVDIVANGSGLISSAGPFTSAGCADAGANYMACSGTSMAAPSVSGSAALILEHYRNLGNQGGTGLPSPNPTSATLKGTLLHTAVDLLNVGPDYQTGWGLVQVDAAANFLTASADTANPNNRVIEDTYAALQPARQFNVALSEGQELKVTLVWSDVAGNGFDTSPAFPAEDLPFGIDEPNPAIVNDLDLSVVGPGGTSFLPWVLDPTQPTAPATNGRNATENVEQVSFVAPTTGAYQINVGTLTGQLGAGASQDFSLLLTLSPTDVDRFEDNNSIADATVLGSEPEVTLRDLTIHDDADVDFFKVTAHDTGKLIVRSFFEHADGDLSLRIVDQNGNVLGEGLSMTDDESVVIPVVGQEMYFVQVLGVAGATNVYALEIENFEAPVPDFVDLPAQNQGRVLNDTGRSVFDNVTQRTEPEIILEADLDDFEQMGIRILDAAQAEAMQLAGAAVEVFVNGNSVGFADPIVGTGNTLFRYTFSAGLLPVTLFPADSEGSLHYVSGAVRIFDGQADANGDASPATARTRLSERLELVVDTVPPAVSAPDLSETSDSGDDNFDDITNIIAPAFQGTAEHNSKIRIFANGVLVGEGMTGSDLTNGSFDQTGSWEVTVEPLKFGQFVIRADAEDLAGNINSAGALRIVVDPYEPNDTTAEATVLGSIPKITLNDVVLHDTTDVDRFKFTATHTGKLIVNAFSSGMVALRVRDVFGNEVSTPATESIVTPGLNRDQIIIPVVSQQDYFIEVVYDGNPPVGPFVQHVAIYDLEIENFAAPLPDTVDLPAKDENEILNDTGMDVFDDVTQRTEPEILIKADLADFEAMGIDILDPDDADFGLLPGAAVQVFVNGDPVGFATEVPGKGGTLFRYRFTAGQLPETNFHADSQGFLHFVTAAVVIFDGQFDQTGMRAPASGRTALSPPLLLRVDEVPPPVSLPDMLASSDSGMFNDDNVTNIRTPTFQGTAEHNAKLRIFAQDVTDPLNLGAIEWVGQGFVGSDLTAGGFDQIGAWEVTIDALDDGVYDIFAEAEDLSGRIARSAALRIEVDTLEPNLPFLDLVNDPSLPPQSDTGRHDLDNITMENRPQVFMTSHDPLLASRLFDDNFKFRVWDRFENEQEYLLYDSTLDDVADSNAVVGDTFTALEILQKRLPDQFFSINGAMFGVTTDPKDPTVGVLRDGLHNLKLEVEDRAGNISHDFQVDVTIDTMPPHAFFGDPTIDNDGLRPDSDTGIWGFPETMSDGITADSTPTLFGRAEANSVVRLYVVLDDMGTLDPLDDTLLEVGQTVATPFDGNEAFPDGAWTITSNVDLQSLALTDSITLRVAAEDRAGNDGAMPDPDDIDWYKADDLTIVLDDEGPKITNVTFGDISEDGVFTLNENTTSVFTPKPTLGPDPLISSIVVHFQDGPLRVAPRLYDAVFAAKLAEEGHFRVYGDANGEIPILRVEPTFVNVDGMPAIARAELVFHDPGGDGVLFTADDVGAPLPDDRFTLSVSDDLTDPAGNALDGESGALAPFEGTDNPPPIMPAGSVNFPNQSEIFPTGDGEHDGSFHARFTIDSRPEFGVWSGGSVYIDLNGNFTFDPDNPDASHRDLVVTEGLATDHIFVGDFDATGFDQLATYSRVGNEFSLTIRGNLFDVVQVIPVDGVVGIPFAGNFDGNLATPDQFGVFTGSQWLIASTPGAFVLDSNVASASNGLPIVGDFDGNGSDDLATYDPVSNNLSIQLSPFGAATGASFTLGAGVPFIGVRERPIAADMDGDGIDDIGLWVPDRSGVTPEESGEWYFYLSGGTPIAGPGSRSTNGAIDFRQTPFGNDLFAQFGDEFAIPIVGNFDPPLTPSSDDHGNPSSPEDDPADEADPQPDDSVDSGSEPDDSDHADPAEPSNGASDPSSESDASPPDDRSGDDVEQGDGHATGDDPDTGDDVDHNIDSPTVNDEADEDPADPTGGDDAGPDSRDVASGDNDGTVNDGTANDDSGTANDDLGAGDNDSGSNNNDSSADHDDESNSDATSSDDDVANTDSNQPTPEDSGETDGLNSTTGDDGGDPTQPSTLVFHNADSPLDVNGDGIVIPRDAVIVINALQRLGGGLLPTEISDPAEHMYYDVSGDGILQPRDALIVINELDRQNALRQSAPADALVVVDRLAFAEAERVSVPAWMPLPQSVPNSPEPAQTHQAVDVVFESWEQLGLDRDPDDDAESSINSNGFAPFPESSNEDQ